MSKSFERKNKELEEEIKRLLRHLPKEKLFGNEKLIKLIKQLQERLEALETGLMCARCNGSGESDHHCDCEYCDMGDECENCGGSGFEESV